LEDIAIDEIRGSSTKRKSRLIFAIEEDTHLISSWLNILTDLIVGVGQPKEAFWLRVTKNYNKIQVVSLKKSGCTDNNVMLHAYAIWKEGEGSDFGLEHAWRLLKDQPKWLDQLTENCFKRTKISAFGAYSSSFNPETLVEDSKADTLPQILHPMGQKAAKRKRKGKRIRTSTNHVDLTGVEEAMRERNVLNARLAVLREKELENEYYDILMKDTSTMSKRQLKDHKAFCKIIRHKLGM
ncbi:Glutathione S-transferase T2, partial [Glycine soja]